jgi:adenylate cyclase
MQAGGAELRQRLVAILAADAAGYSRLMATDERATVASLDAARSIFRQQIESNQGRVIDMAGDSVLAVFETAVGAVVAALAIQRDIESTAEAAPEDRRMRFRVGVHMGDIVEKADGSVYGDGVNIAARLEGLAEPGSVAISESVRSAVRNKVAVHFEDLGEQTVKNIVEPVHAFRIGSGAAQTPETTPRTQANVYRKPSIAVLPFTNMGGDPEQEYFSDGLTEEIITGLAAWRAFPVIARNSTFAFKGKSPDIRLVAKELNADYVLEGSVRKAGTRVRITGQLIDGATGNHLWAERYDRNLDDIFAVQDEITGNIVAAIEPAVSDAEIRRVAQQRPGSVSSWDFYVHGLASMRSYRRHREQTQGLFESALRADPSFVDGMMALALCHSADIYIAQSDDVDASIAAMFRLVNAALAIDARNFRIYHVLCLAHFWRGDLAESVDAGRRAVALNPSSVEAYEVLAAALAHHGLATEAETCARRCFQLSPIDPRLHRFHLQLTQALIGQRRFKEAYAELEHCLAARPQDVVLLGFRVALLGHLGRTEDARKYLDEYISRRRLTDADQYRRLFVRNSALTDINLEGLRAAGWNV